MELMYFLTRRRRSHHGIDVLSYEAPSQPPWKLYANICPQFTELRKKETAPYEMQVLFLEHLLLEHADSIQIYTDGSKVEVGVVMLTLLESL